jgi:hypothetical protein
MDLDYYPDGGAALAAAAIFGFVFFLLAVGFYVLSAFFLMKIFDKAGVKGRWRAWVPVYNFMIFAKLGDLNPWLVLIAAAAAAVLGWFPVIGQIILLLPLLVTLAAAWRVGLKLQKEAPWLILYFFLSIVWLGINAFDQSRWNLNIPAAPWAGNGFLSDTTTWDGVPSQAPAGGYPANPVTTPYGGAPADHSGVAQPAPYGAAPAAAPSTQPPAAAPPTSPVPPAAPEASAPPAAREASIPPIAPEPPTSPEPPTVPPSAPEPPTTPPTAPQPPSAPPDPFEPLEDPGAPRR